ncbi:MAG: LysM peptidoglycan-binding domain-containing protein [Anaerolineae bacterium]
MLKRNLTIVLILMMALWMTSTSTAQDNLLQNPGFNQSGNYRPSGSQQLAVASGWNGWRTLTPSTASWMNIEPIGFPHTAEFKREGDASQNIGRGDATFTAAVYQTVGGVSEGDTYRFSVWVFQDSSEGSGSRTRVGIGSNVGGNPLDSAITWSSWMRSIDSWQEITVEATVPAGSITVFVYSTQSAPRAGNQNYYDDASLTLIGSDGTPNVGSGGDDEDNDGNTVAPPAPPTSTPQTFAPFVSIQPTQESGEVIHTVQSGDTLAAIAVAYGVPASEILELNGLTRDEARFLRIGQQLIISEGSPSAPQDSADDTETSDTQGSGFTQPTRIVIGQVPTNATDDEESPTETAPTDGPIVEEATEELTVEPTPDFTPTPTEIPPTPTDAPPAPVEQGETSDPLSIDTGVCTLMFNDANSNNTQDAGESLLTNGQVTLSDSAGTVLQEYVTDGTSEPFCFDELSAGNYTLSAVAPDGFGLSSSRRAVSVQSDAILVSFGAVEGLEVAAAPTIDPNTTDLEPEPIIEEEPDPLTNLRNIAGIIVLGIAGAVVLGGIVVGVLVGRGR